MQNPLCRSAEEGAVEMINHLWAKFHQISPSWQRLWLFNGATFAKFDHDLHLAEQKSEMCCVTCPCPGWIQSRINTRAANILKRGKFEFRLFKNAVPPELDIKCINDKVDYSSSSCSLKGKTKQEQGLNKAQTMRRTINRTDLAEVQNLKPRTSKNMVYTFYWLLSKERCRRPVNSSKSSHHYRSPPPNYAPWRESRRQLLMNFCLVELRLRHIDQTLREWLLKMDRSVSAPLCRFNWLLSNANSQSPSERLYNSWIQSSRASPLRGDSGPSAAHSRQPTATAVVLRTSNQRRKDLEDLYVKQCLSICTCRDHVCACVKLIWVRTY